MSWHNPKWKYRNAEASKTPGYLARRMKVYARLERMKARATVTKLPLPERKSRNGE